MPIYKSVQILAYADDVDVIGRNGKSARDAYIALKHTAEQMGLKINITKTKYMRGSPDSTNSSNQSLVVEEDTIEAVNEFIYLGMLVNKKNDITSEIKRRTLMANRCYFGLAPLLKSNNISREVKVKI
jgi:sorting nexin-29